MRDFVLIYVNGKRHRVTGRDVFLSLSDFLRYRLGLVGTKIVCSEGDCGACSVLVGRASDGTIDYQVVDSCIQFIFQLDSCHVVSVEGLRDNCQLTPVQEAMIDCHASQCGYCTPGFVVMMTGLLETKDRLAERDLRYGLTGNLCRCTGYSPIIEAGLQACGTQTRRMNELYSPHAILADFLEHAGDTIDVRSYDSKRKRRFMSPTDISGAVELLREVPTAQIVAGATDVGVQMNKGLIDPDMILDLNRVADLAGVHVQDDVVVAGGRATWTEIEEQMEHLVPQFHQILALFGSPQIRNVGTIGGNLANASPIADSLPFLFVMGSQLELQGPDGTRQVDINTFYHGFKRTDLRPGELITRVRIPLPNANQILRLYKVSRRRDLDIASVTAAILVQCEDQSIVSATIAFGAVGPTVLRARRTEAFLLGRPLTEQTMHEAGAVAVEEISPVSDVRGSMDYRYQLARNILLKFYHDVHSELAPVMEV